MTNLTALDAPDAVLEIPCVSALATRLVPAGGTLLAVWAHPDDESYLGGGLMAAAARIGARVVNVSATRGEHGTADPASFPPSRLAPIRERELGSALGALGARPAPFLGHVDGTCHRMPDREGAEQVGAVIDELAPDAVLTFDDDGVTGHADHRAVARWTRQAVGQRGDAVPLVTTVVGSAWPTELVDRMHTVSMFYPGFPAAPPEGTSVRVAVSGTILEAKLAALREHRSQVGPLHEALGADGYRLMASIEAYRGLNLPAALRLADLAPAPDRSEALATGARAA